MRLATRSSSAAPRPTLTAQNPARLRAEALFNPPAQLPPAGLPNQTPHTVSGLDQSLRSRVFAVIGHNRVGSVNTQHLRRLMREVVTWIPDFKEFAALCTESLHNAWQYDQDFKVRTARTTRAQWLRLFRYFAQRQQIDAELRIQAINKSGYYVCELAPRRKEDTDWRDFFRLGRQLGVTQAEMKRLKAQAEARALDAQALDAQAATASGKNLKAAAGAWQSVTCDTSIN